MDEPTLPDPVVRVDGARELAEDLLVIPNHGVPLVPNVGVIGGTHSVLVVETGMGPDNAEAVLKFAADFAKGRKLYLTTTHFHPEHAFGARSFAGAATYLLNRAQAEDLRTKGQGYLGMFRGLGEAIARRLDGVEIPEPDVVFDAEYTLDLGGRLVRLRPTGRAHSRGDQVVTVPDAGVMFTGDLAEAGQFAIFPWFPPHDTDVSGTRWLAVMERLSAERPPVVVPGHGDIGDAGLLDDVGEYLRLLRDETWTRRDSAMSEATIIAEVRAAMIARHPEWEGRDWIDKGVACFCAEH
ncbi:MBL fold metallo-hydrolase [Dactylosporangium sp. NPDC048998]|uniref:MBL fold metallo-hydrolase n=1 Tax=Dactylosporangium sp. NPDC048998 TaxID=3363976 RepID=UPI0037202D0A